MKSNESVNACRICGATGEIIIPIFSKNAIIADKINKCLPVNIKKNDVLSKYICPRCLSALNVSYNLYILSETIDKLSRQGSSRFETDIIAKKNAKIIENETEETEDDHQDYPNYPILEKSLKIVLERLPDNFNNNNTNDFEQVLLKEETFGDDEDHTNPMEPFESVKTQNTEFETIYIKIDEDFLMPEEEFMNEANNRPKKRRGRPKREVSFNNSVHSCDDKEKKEKGRYDFRKKDENYRKKIKDIIKLFESDDEIMEESKEEVKLQFKSRVLKMPEKRATTERENPFPCSICDRIFRRKRGLQLHMNLHLSPKHWKYQCKKCKEKFPNIGSYSKHKSAGHPSYHTYICNMCDYSFSSRSDMEKHKVAEHFTYVSYDED